MFKFVPKTEQKVDHIYVLKLQFEKKTTFKEQRVE